eukprot:gene10453-2975_t
MAYISGGKLGQQPGFFASIVIYFWSFVEIVQLFFTTLVPNPNGSTSKGGQKNSGFKSTGRKINSMNHQDTFNPSSGCGPSG